MRQYRLAQQNPERGTMLSFLSRQKKDAAHAPAAIEVLDGETGTALEPSQHPLPPTDTPDEESTLLLARQGSGRDPYADTLGDDQWEREWEPEQLRLLEADLARIEREAFGQCAGDTLAHSINYGAAIEAAAAAGDAAGDLAPARASSEPKLPAVNRSVNADYVFPPRKVKTEPLPPPVFVSPAPAHSLAQRAVAPSTASAHAPTNTPHVPAYQQRAPPRSPSVEVVKVKAERVSEPLYTLPSPAHVHHNESRTTKNRSPAPSQSAPAASLTQQIQSERELTLSTVDFDPEYAHPLFISEQRYIERQMMLARTTSASGVTSPASQVATSIKRANSTPITKKAKTKKSKSISPATPTSAPAHAPPSTPRRPASAGPLFATFAVPDTSPGAPLRQSTLNSYFLKSPSTSTK